jgi:hypothetical protein
MGRKNAGACQCEEKYQHRHEIRLAVVHSAAAAAMVDALIEGETMITEGVLTSELHKLFDARRFTVPRVYLPSCIRRSRITLRLHRVSFGFEEASATVGLVKYEFEAGCKCVVASPWPLDSRVPSYWLPAFLSAWENGQAVIDAAFEANQAVKSRFSAEQRDYLAMNVYGDGVRARSAVGRLMLQNVTYPRTPHTWSRRAQLFKAACDVTRMVARRRTPRCMMVTSSGIHRLQTPRSTALRLQA